MIEAISGIAGVMKRISQIENMMSVNHSELRGLNFQKVLDNEQQKIKNTDSGINSNTKVDGDFSFENIRKFCDIFK